MTFQANRAGVAGQGLKPALICGICGTAEQLDEKCPNTMNCTNGAQQGLKPALILQRLRHE